VVKELRKTYILSQFMAASCRNCLAKKRNKKPKQLMRWKRERGIERPRQEDKARIETTRELSWAA
jgi:hypothetical protein